MAGLSLHASGGGHRSQGRDFAATLQWSAQSTRSRPAARGKQPHVQDVFSVVSYNSWPSASDDHWSTVCSRFVTTNSPAHSSLLFWSALLATREQRGSACAENTGRCLNCHGTDHSMRECPENFMNRSGILNSQLGLFADDGIVLGASGKAAYGPTVRTLQLSRISPADNKRSAHHPNRNSEADATAAVATTVVVKTSNTTRLSPKIRLSIPKHRHQR